MFQQLYSSSTLPFSDIKIPVDDNTDGVIDWFEGDPRTSQDYYPFGMLMPERQYSLNSVAYRYGFNGMERDDEAKGNGNSYDFGARIYDSRLGKWMSLDPLQAKYPSLSPYNFVANSPIIFVDPDGQKIDLSNLSKSERKEYKSQIKVLKKSAIFRKMYRRVKRSNTNVIIKWDANSLGSRTNESSSGGDITVTFGAANSVFLTRAVAQELFHSYQYILKARGNYGELGVDYTGADLEAEGEVATYYILKQAGRKYTPFGEGDGIFNPDGSYQKDPEGNPIFMHSPLFSSEQMDKDYNVTKNEGVYDNAPSKKEINSDEFNEYYQEYKGILNQEYKNRKYAGNNDYTHHIDNFTKAKAVALKSLIGGKKKQ